MVELDLYGLYLQGETLIIEHVGFRETDDRESWVRLETHRVVGHPAEDWVLHCDAPMDHSELKGPPGDEDDDCRLCRASTIHTKALHARLLAEARRADQPLEL